jgi:hypothetical protein
MHPALSLLQQSIDGQGERAQTTMQSGATGTLFERFMA